MLQTNLINFSFALALLLWLFQLVVVVVVIILFVAGSLYNFCMLSLSSLTMPSALQALCLLVCTGHASGLNQAGTPPRHRPLSPALTSIHSLSHSLPTHSFSHSVIHSFAQLPMHSFAHLCESQRLPRAFYNTFQCSLQGICSGIQP